MDWVGYGLAFMFACLSFAHHRNTIVAQKNTQEAIRQMESLLDTNKRLLKSFNDLSDSFDQVYRVSEEWKRMYLATLQPKVIKLTNANN